VDGWLSKERIDFISLRLLRRAPGAGRRMRCKAAPGSGLLRVGLRGVGCCYRPFTLRLDLHRLQFGTRPLAWFAFVLDYGTLAFLPALPHIGDELWRTSRFNLLEEYGGQQGNKTVRLRLFRKGVFTIEQHFRRERGECGLSQAGTWTREDGRLLLRLDGESTIFDTLPGVEYEAVIQASGFRGYENDELSLAGVELRLKLRRAA
jgi:hypothetical protein